MALNLAFTFELLDWAEALLQVSRAKLYVSGVLIPLSRFQVLNASTHH